MLLDFKKFNDPVWQAQMAAEREEKEAALQVKDDRIRNAVDVLSSEPTNSSLTRSERGLVGTCQRAVNTLRPLSEKQELWLFDIAARFDCKFKKDNAAATAESNSPAPFYEM